MNPVDFNSNLSRRSNFARPRRFYPLTCQFCNLAFPTGQGILEHYRAHMEALGPTIEEAPLPQQRQTPNPNPVRTQSPSFFQSNNNRSPFIGSSSPSRRQIPPPSSSSTTTDTNNGNNLGANSAFLSTYLPNRSRLHLLDPNHAEIFNGLDQSNMYTCWLIGQLEHSIPSVIDLEEENNGCGLDLELKL